ncbi:MULTISPECIES: hypothetical protein [Peribacillus]|uniref:hypothetical protein n=1 Tax=Peribacillus TaxID=2675229 RepID=UPI002040278E|nr:MULTISPECIES: hypothetical protein [Peribacillus]MCM3673945.1 hypothetical protein [Peribacillus simplex]MDQ0883367.1 hypothetical protein [Peribacillus sp. V2I11]
MFNIYGIAALMSHGMVPGACELAIMEMLFTAYSYGLMAKSFLRQVRYMRKRKESINTYAGFLVGNRY